MSDGSLRAKQEKLQLEIEKTSIEDKTSHTVEEHLPQNRQNESAIPEWQRFYEAVKEITSDMRY